MPDLKPILIAGPTASGKSALAASFAREQNCVIINADALQVYSCWRILTARPSVDDEHEFPHSLYGHVTAETRYSVGTWIREVAEVLSNAKANGIRPIFVGGTGLYMKALTSGLAHIPEISNDLRNQAERMVRDGDLNRLLQDLESGDPELMKKLDRKNPARVIRAWEVLKSTGRPMSYWQSQGAKPLIDSSDCSRFLVAVEADDLNDRIERRFHWMVENGGISECETYIKNFPSKPSVPSSKALGARQLIDYIQGETSLDAAIESSVIETRQFAKRQRTWIRNQMKDWNPVRSVSDMESASE